MTGRHPVIRVLDQEEARALLLDKLGEEAEELRLALPEDLPGEIADLLEIVRALASEHEVAWDVVERVADEKVASRAAFQQRLFLERVEEALA